MKEEYNPEVFESEEDTSSAVESHEEWALRKKREAMVISRFQAREALRDADLLESVEATIYADGVDARIVHAWDDVTEFRRTSPSIAAIAGLLGMSDEQIDDLFVRGSQIKV